MTRTGKSLNTEDTESHRVSFVKPVPSVVEHLADDKDRKIFKHRGHRVTQGFLCKTYAPVVEL